MTVPQFTREVFNPSLIEIEDTLLMERLARVTPLVLRGDDLFRFDLPDLRGVAFTWEPKNCKLVDAMENHKDHFVELCRTTVQFSCAYYGFFKPTIAEVLAQLPADPDITSFYLDSNSVRVLDEGEGHVCTAHWLTNKPRSEEWQRARIEKRLSSNG